MENIVEYSNKYEAEYRELTSILYIAGITLEELSKEDLYDMEIKVHGFPFDALLNVLMVKYNFDDDLRELFRGPGFNNMLDRLIAVKEYLSEKETIRGEVVEKVIDIVN